MITHTGYELGTNSLHSLTDKVNEKIIEDYKKVISEACVRFDNSPG